MAGTLWVSLILAQASGWRTPTKSNSVLQLEHTGTRSFGAEEYDSNFSLTEEPIDIVYCWAGETKVGCHSTVGGWQSDGEENPHDSGCDNGELMYSLRSVEQYAPWIHKIHILVNGEPGATVPLPSFVQPNTSWIKMVNRCDLFPDSGDCPTFNSFACYSVVHKVPELSKRFLYMDDDFLFTNSLTKDVLFTSSGLPRVFSASKETSSMYSGDPLPQVPVPRKLARTLHVPIVLDKEFLDGVERSYPQWFAFVRSHKRRYCCCDDSIAKANGANCIDEEVAGVWMAEMLAHGQGIIDVSEPDPFCELDCKGAGPACPAKGLTCVETELSSSTRHFMNLNNLVKGDTAAQVKAMLQKKFGNPASFEVSRG